MDQICFIPGTKIIFRIYGLVCAVVLVLFTLINFYNMKEGGFKTDLGEDVDPKNVSFSSISVSKIKNLNVVGVRS